MKTAIVAMVLALALTASGCMQYRQQAQGVTPAASAGCPDMSRGCTKTVWSFAWGAFYAGLPESAACGRVGLQEVTVRTRPLEFAVGLVTVGLVTPRRLEWKCAAPAPDEGIIRDPLSRSSTPR